MIYPIVRMYAGAQQAAAAVSSLKAARFAADAISVIVASEALKTPKDIEAALTAAFVPRAETSRYVQGVQAGSTVVVVRAPFGGGVLANKLLDSAGPVDSGLKLHAEPFEGWDDAAPLSSALHIPVLSSKISSPYSTPCLLTRNGGTLSSALGFAELKESGTPSTEGLGMPMLSRNPAPLSALLRLPLLRR